MRKLRNKRLHQKISPLPKSNPSSKLLKGREGKGREGRKEKK
jgi:hypothetical protein